MAIRNEIQRLVVKHTGFGTASIAVQQLPGSRVEGRLEVFSACSQDFERKHVPHLRFNGNPHPTTFRSDRQYHGEYYRG